MRRGKAAARREPDALDLVQYEATGTDDGVPVERIDEGHEVAAVGRDRHPWRGGGRALGPRPLRPHRPAIPKQHEQIGGAVEVDVDDGSRLAMRDRVELFDQIGLAVEVAIRFASNQRAALVIFLDVGLAVEIGVDVDLGDLPARVEVSPEIGVSIAVPIGSAHRVHRRPDVGGSKRRTERDAERCCDPSQKTVHRGLTENTSRSFGRAMTVGHGSPYKRLTPFDSGPNCAVVSTSVRAAARTIVFVSMLLASRPILAQQRPLETQDPETLAGGQVRIEAGIAYARDMSYPLSGLTGNLWQLPVARVVVGLSTIADIELSGGPYDRLDITDRQPAPLADLVKATGSTTHAVDDIVVAMKIRAVPESGQRPALGLLLSVRLPNAKHPSGLGQDTTDFSAAVLAAKSIAALRVGGNLGVTIMSEPLDASKQNDVLTYGASAVVSLSRQSEVVAEIDGRWSTRPGPAPVGTESRGNARLGLRTGSSALRVDAAVSFGITAIDPSVGVTAGVTYTFKAFSLP